ncbi:MAG TPA: hypothetical protein VI643_02760, partial [Planctomycetota bacterium]|nr:hypothetical protein [Planctomycetota bacterium]
MSRRTPGFSLATVLVVSILVGGIVLAFFDLSMIEAKGSNAIRTRMQAKYMAEAGAEEAAHQIRSAIANYQALPAGGAITISGVSVLFSIVQVGSDWSETDPAGLMTLNRQFEIVATARFDGSFARVSRVVVAGAQPLFQFVAFYDGDLETQPGPAMTLHGRIHTNSDLHIGSNATLTVDSEYVHSAGGMFRHRKENGAAMPGIVSVRVAGTSLYEDWETALESSAAGWVAGATSKWNGTVKDGAMGIGRMEIPQPQSIQPNGYFHQNAGLVIEDNKVFSGGTDITSSLPAGTISTTLIYDARESVYVPVSKLDMDLLKESGYYPANGLLYAHRTSSSASNPQGLMLTNGANLGGAMTVVSPDPVYIRGDYNSVEKKPAAVIADAVNLLSNAWTNTKSPSNG